MFGEIIVVYPGGCPKHKAKCSFLMQMHVVDIFSTGVNTIFGLRRNEVTGEGRRLHNVKLYPVLLTKYCAGVKIENNEMGRACSAYG
jgi:hypothetical protein